jgi:(1->4)-alpha-D-glucan 1-alpha-D-glucosylmutase
VKLFLVQRALQARKRNPALFQIGEYIPLTVRGHWKDHVIAFARRDPNSWAIAVAPRMLTRLVNDKQFPVDAAVWKDTEILLPEEAHFSWRDAISGHVLPNQQALTVASALKYFPAALLISES